ncbi:MAG: hypothetical protein IID39_03935, partial [Planctomycetes bacterium]|nr:hypothetical protein [Planctomycetota bacterium]
MKLLERQRRATVTLRPWPDPYRAALAICNDIDWTTWTDFLQIHRFLNTRRSTPLGDGLGLPIGDSYWMYTVRPEHDPGFAYFEDLEGNPSAVAPRMREMMHAGLLDVLHTYGNFSQRGGFRRHHAEWAAAELQRWGVAPQVWVMHGDCHNFQNIHGQPGHVHCKGGRKYCHAADGFGVRSLEYHLDITYRLGVRFLWVSDLTQDIGQDRKLTASEHLFDRNELKEPVWLRRDLFRYGRAWFSPSGLNGRRGLAHNSLLGIYDLEPGPYYRFTRFGRFGTDCMQHLPILLCERHLDTLTELGGVMIVFVHLGKRVDPAGPVFDESARSVLTDLARRYHSGELYIQTTSRLLRYIAVRDHIDYSLNERDGHPTLNIEQVKDPVLGTFVPTDDDLAGLCFEVRSATEPSVAIAEKPNDDVV